MYNFYDVLCSSAFINSEYCWFVLTFEGTDVPIVEYLDTKNDASEVKALRLSEGFDRIKRYCKNSEDVLAENFPNAPWFEHIAKYIESNNFMWGLDLQSVIFKNGTCTRLTKIIKPKTQ